MAETDAIIRVSATGASEASAAIGSVTQSMQGIGQEHNQLVDKFGHRFEHLGLQLFAGEALRAQGVGRETREVVNILGLAFSSLGAAMGPEIIVIMGLVAAFTAFLGIANKVHEHNEKMAKELEKLNEENRKQLQSTVESIKSIDSYVLAAGHVPPELGRWREAEEALRKVQIQRQIDGDKAMVSSITNVMNAARERIASLKDEVDAQKKIVDDLQKSGVDQSVITAQKARLSELTAEYKKLGDQQVENKVKLEGLFVEIKRLNDGITSSLKEQTEELNKAAKASSEKIKKEIEDENKRYQDWGKNHEEQLKKTIAYSKIEMEMNKDHHKLTLDNYDKERDEYDKLTKGLKAATVSSFNAMSATVGTAFGEMMVRGKNFQDAVAHIWSDLAVQVVAAITQMMVKWIAFQALTGGTGGGSFGFLFGGAHAEGGSVLVNQPTLFLAGEAGQPEIATFTPLSKLGSGSQNVSGLSQSGGSNIQIGNIENHIHGVNDPDQIADIIGQKIIERVRGMGELNFTRTG